MSDPDAAVLIRGPPDESFMLEGVEPVDGGLVGDDLASKLNFSDEGSSVVFCHVAQNIVEHHLLLTGEDDLGQTGLRRG